MGPEGKDSEGWTIHDMLDKLITFQKEGQSPGGQKEIEFNLEKFIDTPKNYIEELYSIMQCPLPAFTANAWEKRVLQSMEQEYLVRRTRSTNVPNIASVNDRGTDKLRNGQLVTFRCIIQDDLGPEMCPLEVRTETVRKSTLLQDIDNINDESREAEALVADGVSQRDLLVGITPPGEMGWVSGNSNEKIGFNNEEKRSKMDEDKDDLIGLPNYQELFPELFKNVGEAKPFVSLLKVYNSNLKPNDLVEVAGIFEAENSEHPPDENSGIAGLTDFYPKYWKLPKIFVFSCLKLADGNPNIPMFEGKMFPTFNTFQMQLSECVQTLRELLALGLGGDRYAAVYAMVAMVSKIIHRQEMGYGPIGKYALNISGISESSDILETFQYILKSILPRMLLLDFNIDNVNTWKLTPKKNLDTNQLETGLFQMAPGTQLVINETRLKEGAFDPAGANNIAVLRELIQYQHVKYDYMYQHPELPSDTPIIILSDNPSVLPVDVKIGVKADTKLPYEERRSRIEQILSEKGTCLRNYLSIVRAMVESSNPVFAEESLNGDFEAFFRSRNQPDVFKSKMTPSQFSAFITSCRLWAVLNGELSITREAFMFWKDLEIIRDGRLP